jgi:hypothetical protein
MNKIQKISSKATKSSKPKSKKLINESNAKSNPNYLSNRSKKCKSNNNICSTSSTSDKNKDNNKRKKYIKKIKSRPVKIVTKRKMNKSSTSSTSPVSPRAKSKTQMTTSITILNEDDMNDMPVLTPEVPFESQIDNEFEGNDNLLIPSIDANGADLVPPVLSPALDQESKAYSNCDKSRNKRKSKIQSFKDEDELISSLYQFNDNSNDLEIDKKSTKKFKSNVKTSVKKSTKLIKTTKDSNKYLQKSIQKSIQKSKGKLYNSNSYNINANKMLNFNNGPNVWSVDCNHTMTPTSNSFSLDQPFINFSNKRENFSTHGMDSSQSQSILVNKHFDESFKLMKPKIFKKFKSGFSSQSNKMSNKRTKKSLFNDLIGVKKPEPEIDEIENIVFQSFETEESINLFTKFEMLEKDQLRDDKSNCKLKIKSFKSGKVIYPTKTRDITKIKGWREKLFSSIDDKQTKRFTLCKPLENSTSHENIYSSLPFNPTTAQSSKGSNSAFVSDILDGYLKNKSDLKLNYLDPDLAPPPDDSPIFSASVLKMPDFSMPPPPNPSSSQSNPSPIKRKGNFGRSKGLKNKLNLKTDFSESIEFLNDSNYFDETSNFAHLVPNFPIIRETQWPELPLSDVHLSLVYDEYVNMTHNEMQMMKKFNLPSFIMDDHYARYALSALQCNERIQFANNDQNDNSNQSILSAVGLAPKKRDSSPVKEPKITGRYRKDREADLAKIIAMGNRSRRQIRLPSRFHESSLLMGNQWIIPDYDQKGKTGKRRLQQEQKRLQELHQRQLELEQRNHLVHLNDQSTNSNDDSQLTIIRSNKKKKLNSPKVNNSLNIPVFSNDYPLKIPQRLKQSQIIRNRKTLMKNPNRNISLINKKNETLGKSKSFTSLYSLATQTSDDKRHVSLSAKAAASASQRAVVNQLFYQLFETISPDKQNMFSRNGKINKLEVIKEAIETIERLTKRDQQLCYIRKLLSMWNHKLQLCDKVSQKGIYFLSNFFPPFFRYIFSINFEKFFQLISKFFQLIFKI